MPFNSISFAIFLPVVFILYWCLVKNNTKAQNILLLAASYVFYSWWDFRFLVLLIVLSLVNYFIGIRISETENDNKRKSWLILGLIIDLGILGVFKYLNFFINSFIDLFTLVGYNLSRSTINIVLPLGISFYVFLLLSYILDVYKRTYSANRNIIDVLLSFGFFPIILAGPIHRPSLLIPQISRCREFNYFQIVDGLKQILWGLFVKVVIADNLAFYVDDFFLNYSSYSGSTLLVGAIFYTIQIYADFSGYSDMAIGTAKLFGFNLMRNFAYPYFARDISEFWKRWHISLTTWFRDYIFLPLAFTISWKIKGERVFHIKTDLFLYMAASAVTWLLTGLWHGASYTFLVWGLIHGFFLILYRWHSVPRKKIFKRLGIDNANFLLVITETFFTLLIVITAWIVFRSENLDEAFSYMKRILSNSLLTIPEFPFRKMAFITSILTSLFLLIEWIGRDQKYAIARLGVEWYRTIRWALYYFIIALIIYFGGTPQQFIYFQF